MKGRQASYCIFLQEQAGKVIKTGADPIYFIYFPQKGRQAKDKGEEIIREVSLCFFGSVPMFFREVSKSES